MEISSILSTVSLVAFVLAAILIVLALVKGRKNMKLYYRWSIVGLIFLLIGEVVTLFNEYAYVSNQINMFNVLFLVLTIILIVYIIVKSRKM